MNSIKLLNLACGAKIAEKGNWVNIDFSSPRDNVKEMNILNGLDFNENTFDVVYSAQFIEHLTLGEAEKVLMDIYRVMKPGAILRLVTPDLEELARTYIMLLDKLKSGEHNVKEQYEWIRLEIFDQIVRDYSGGEVYDFIEKSGEETKQYISERIGYTYDSYFYDEPGSTGTSLINKIIKNYKKIPKKIKSVISSYLVTENIKIGQFRKSGEVHRYLHDEYSLSELLTNSGFKKVERVNSDISGIDNWSGYELDIIKGRVDAPKSLYLEAYK